MLDGILRADEDDVVLVISQPDRPKGRGKKLEPTPVKALALDHGVEVEQPTKLRDGTVAARLDDLDLDLSIVVAYGRILPRAVFEAPRFDTWNVHASLLPRWRGASPIQRSIEHGDHQTGVTLMQLAEAMDEGDMLLKRTTDIRPDDTGGSLTERLAHLGAQVAVDGLALAKSEGLEVIPQDDEKATYAGLIEKKDGLIDFGRTSAELDCQVRAFDPWPGTFVPLASGQPLKIRRVQIVDDDQSARDAQPGQIIGLEPHLRIKTSDGALDILEVQPPGKRAMSSDDFLRGAGRHLQIGRNLHEC